MPDADGRILVTGATGLVGRALVERLLADRVHSSSAPAVRAAVRAVTAPIRASGHDAEMVAIGDLSDAPPWDRALADVSCVIHCAGLAHLPAREAASAAERFAAINVDATLTLARAAIAAGVRRLVFVSSIKVNGESTLPGRPFTPDDAPAAAESSDDYGRSKVAAEQGLMRLAAESRLEVVIVRPPLVYGAGARGNFGALLRAVAAGVPLPLRSVTNRRSLVALDNLVDFLVVATRHEAAAGQVLLVSDGDDLSTPDLVRHMGRALGRPPRLIPCPPAALVAGASMLGCGAAMRRLLGSLQVDTRSSRALLDWTPPLGVEAGMRRAVAPLLDATTH